MRYRQQGLTLVELMVTLAVAIILMAVGIPMFNGFADSNRATVQANSLVAALKLARSEAVNRKDTVTVCSGDGLVCGGAGDWATGWFVHTDVNESGGLDADDVLRRWGALVDGSRIDVTGGAFVTFAASGESTAGVNVTFQTNNLHATGIANDPDIAKRCITVSVSGQVRMSKGGCP